MSDYFGITNEDLEPKVPEKLIFTADKEIKAKIIDITEKEGEKNGNAYSLLILTTKILSEEHNDKLFDVVINRLHKESFVRFLKAFWSLDELQKAIEEGELADISRLVGRQTSFIAGKGKKVGEKTYQNFNYYTDLGMDESEPTKSRCDF